MGVTYNAMTCIGGLTVDQHLDESNYTKDCDGGDNVDAGD